VIKLSNFFEGLLSNEETQTRLKRVSKEYIPSIVERYNSELSDNEKFFIALLIYDRIFTVIQNSDTLEVPIEIILDSLYGRCYDTFNKLKVRFPNKLRQIFLKIEAKKYTLSKLPDIGDIEINLLLNEYRKINTVESITDESFSISLFNIPNNILFSMNKIDNLKKLFQSCLYPLVIYFKAKLNFRGNLLFIAESINNSDPLQKLGKAVIFNLTQVDRNEIIEAVESKKVICNCGILKKYDKDDNSLYISLPYNSEGKIIRDYIENKIKWLE
jgi:hypothetical protein